MTHDEIEKQKILKHGFSEHERILVEILIDQENFITFSKRSAT